MANRQQIDDLIRDCWYFFRSTQPRQETLDSWAGELEGIDLWNAGEFIRRRFKMASKFPDNFPVAIKAIYREWMRTQPRATDDDQGCPQCLSGTIHGIKQVGRYPYVFAFRCGHCHPDLPYPEATRQSLIDQGYKLDWQHDYNGPVDKKAVKSYYEPDEIPF
jgi:hypothetical protein